MPSRTMIVAGMLSLAVAGGTGCATPEANAPKHSNVDQVAAGSAIYLANCSKCHGAVGQGTNDGPAVVGKDALPLDPRPGAKIRTGQFRTAGDILEFIKAKMPADKPGSLSDDDYASILAFALKANGVDLHHERINEANAPQIVLHP